MPGVAFEVYIQALLSSLLFCWILMPLQSINVVCEIEFVEIEFMPIGNRGDCINAFELGIARF